MKPAHSSAQAKPAGNRPAGSAAAGQPGQRSASVAQLGSTEPGLGSDVRQIRACRVLGAGEAARPAPWCSTGRQEATKPGRDARSPGSNGKHGAMCSTPWSVSKCRPKQRIIYIASQDWMVYIGIHRLHFDRCNAQPLNYTSSTAVPRVSVPWRCTQLQKGLSSCV
jgi:hypothetical protein